MFNTKKCVNDAELLNETGETTPEASQPEQVVISGCSYRVPRLGAESPYARYWGRNPLPQVFPREPSRTREKISLKGI